MEAELKANGADHVLVDGDDLAQRVHQLLGGRGVDRALDAVAGSASGRLFDAVADFGTLTCYGLLGSDDVVFNAAQFIFRDVHVQGYSRLRYSCGGFLVPMPRRCILTSLSVSAKACSRHLCSRPLFLRTFVRRLSWPNAVVDRARFLIPMLFGLNIRPITHQQLRTSMAEMPLKRSPYVLVLWLR